jgi:hypothetical protein
MLRYYKIMKLNFLLKIITVLFIFSFSNSWGQIYVHDFGSTTISASPYTVSPPTINTNLSSSQWTSSTGTFTNFGGSSGQALSLNNSSGTPSLTLTFSVAAGCTLDITSFNFWRQRSASGAQNWTLTINGVVVGSGTVPTTGASIGNSSVASAVNGLTGNVSVVLSLSGASGTGTFRLDDFTLSGSTSCSGGCTPPTTTVSPTSQTICVGSVTTLTVASSATTPSYTWQASANGTSGWTSVVNGTPSGASYSGGSTSTLAITAGSTYYYRAVVADGGTCTATSGTSSLTVISSPSITSSPASASITTAGTATFVAVASGTGLSYQWQVNSGSGFVNVSGGVYSGATTATLSISNPSLAMNSYSYQCVVSNSCGTATTSVATLTVTSGPCINEGFNGGAVAPSGWTFNSIGGTYTSAGNFGASSPALTIDGTGDQVTTIALSGNVATSLSFWLKGQGTDASSSLLVEGFDGVSWTTIDNIAPLPTTGTTKTYNSGTSPPLPSSIFQFRFTYTKSAGNLSFDDVIVNCGPSCTAPTTTVSATTQTVCLGTVVSLGVTTSATSPSFTWQASANGTSGWATVVNGTPSGASYSGANASILTVTTASSYFYRVLVADGGTCTATSSTSTLVVNTVSIASQPISVSTTSTGTASYSVTVSGSGSGLSYQWQENSGSGFTNITNGGSNPTYAGATSSVLTISNPPMSMSGYSYQCIISNACGTVTTNGTSTLTVTSALTCPFIQGVLINGCAGSCSAEGNNEFLVLNSGSYSIPVNSTNLNLTYNNGSNINFTGGFTAQPGDITNLNTLAGCNVFVDASTGTIPANSTFMVMNQGSCFNNGFTDFCSAGTVYVVFSNDADWLNVGFFANTGNSARSFITNFTSLTGGSCGTTTYTYLPDNLQNGDGASLSYSVPGGSPTYLNGTGNCAPPLAILPIELIDFYGTQNGPANELVWKVVSEKNVSQYIIEKSEDGVIFSELTRINAIGSEGNFLIYSCEDSDPFTAITYYRLSTLENNQSINHYRIIDLDRENKDWKSLIFQENDELIIEWKNYIPKDASVAIFDLSGKELLVENASQAQTKIDTKGLATGIYFVRMSTAYKTENFKIVIQK